MVPNGPSASAELKNPPAMAATDHDDLNAELHDQRVGLGELLQRDFSHASAADMVRACEERLAQAGIADFEESMLREFIAMLSGRGDGRMVVH